ncbi:D-2-hydroxyacid dehydrogenase [Bacillus sp. FJAT-27231]|uniref:D-2-hydroxyacid dehydrogenase n=1 Tax=Bacillus sp. FJAT-27231 TaxID=1679168 RepID=UPI0006707EA7|nr:D-2-hydroxyacid dehydrogenase [Bacillus sp. FJAT-27231]
MILCTSSDLLKEQLQRIREETQKNVVQNKIILLSEAEKQQVECILTYGNFDDAITAEELEQLPNVKWIQTMSSGTEQLPHNMIEKKNIHVTSAKGVHAISISEYVLGAMLHFAKKIEKFQVLKKNKVWADSEEMFELHGKTMCVLGTGHIGQEIARKTKVFGMNILGVNRSGNHVEGFDEIYSLHQIAEIFPQCDYICSALPSTIETRDLIKKETIDFMKDGVVFINVGRGDLIVEEDFIQALQAGKIGGAALDVFKSEPLEYGHPLWSTDNLIITPHASYKTNRYIHRVLAIFLANYNYFKYGDFEGMINKIN